MKMTTSVAESISKFTTFFRDRLDEIGQITNVTYAHQYQKMLFVSALDALARVRWPKETSNQKRFTAFVDEFSKWPDNQRISLPHLDKLLKNTGEPEFSALREFVRLKMSKWKAGKVYSLDVDPETEEVVKFWPKANNGKDATLLGIGPESLTHVKLLYACRNTLLHEFRSPSADLSSAGPCYVNQVNVPYERGRTNDVWVLSYPVSFIKNLTTNCLDRLEEYLMQNQIDPYDSFVFGDFWIESLNRD
jgi:hypothetical protein